MSSEVAVFDEELPLSEAQIEKLVKLVVRRVEEAQRDQHQSREATDIRREARPPFLLAD